jgi:hypothetical protein
MDNNEMWRLLIGGFIIALIPSIKAVYKHFKQRWRDSHSSERRT